MNDLAGPANTLCPSFECHSDIAWHRQKISSCIISAWMHSCWNLGALQSMTLMWPMVRDYTPEYWNTWCDQHATQYWQWQDTRMYYSCIPLVNMLMCCFHFFILLLPEKLPFAHAQFYHFSYEITKYSKIYYNHNLSIEACVEVHRSD